MRAIAVVALVLATVAHVEGQAGDKDKGAKRYGIELETKQFPQGNPKEALGSVLKAIATNRVDYVLAHLAGAELYNHACLNADLDGFRGMVRAAGIAGGYREFNEWCVRQRRGLPAAEVLAEWREASEMFGDDAPMAATALASVQARRTPQSTNPDAVKAALAECRNWIVSVL